MSVHSAAPRLAPGMAAIDGDCRTEQTERLQVSTPVWMRCATNGNTGCSQVQL